MKRTNTLMVFFVLMLLTASIGGCFHPYRYRSDYDSYRQDRWHDSRDYRGYGRRDRD
jgi:hypothetical protein